MARTVKPEEYAARRKEILDAAMRLVFSKGYQRFTVQDILDAVHISSGAFHHYFDSREALLEDLTGRMLDQSEVELLPIVRDAQLSAREKMQRFFGTLNQLRVAHKSTVVDMLRAWYADDNAIVRQKMDGALVERRAPLLTEIVYQGVREGVFSAAYPAYAGEVILSLLQGMSNTHARQMLAIQQETDEDRCVAAILDTYGAYMSAIELVLGAPVESLFRLDADMVRLWVTALRGESVPG
jgi:AcrR family transcriptional regulator